MNKNGTLKTKLDKAKKWAEKKKEKEESIQEVFELTPEDEQKIADIKKRIKAMRRRG
jgi:ABC-type enterochelin transport system substrate-binding protein